VGAAHEHDEGPGRRDGDGTDLRVVESESQEEPVSIEETGADASVSSTVSNEPPHSTAAVEETPPQGPRQLTLFPDEEEQVKTADRLPMSEDDIDYALTLGGPVEGSKERIASVCMEYAKPRDIAESLKREYGIGGGSVVYPDGTKGWMQCDAKGIRLYKGENEGCRYKSNVFITKCNAGIMGAV
jgi:hypothetical protein